MEIKDLKPKTGDVEIEVEVESVTEPREFQKFGKTGNVATATVKDKTGSIKMSLWNEQIDLVKQAKKIKITQGYVNVWQDEPQLTTGKFGKIEVVE